MEHNPNDLIKHLLDGLNPEQKWYHRAVKWLFTGPSSSGRTRLLATILIEMAIENPSTPISIPDHRTGSSEVPNAVLAILEQATATFPWVPDYFIMLGAQLHYDPLGNVRRAHPRQQPMDQFQRHVEELARAARENRERQAYEHLRTMPSWEDFHRGYDNGQRARRGEISPQSGDSWGQSTASSETPAG